MIDLIRSYRETKKYTTNQKKELASRIEALGSEIQRKKMEGDLSGIQMLINEVERNENTIQLLNAAISDANYIISWLTTGRRPGAVRGIERRAVYEREVTFESKYLDLFVDNNVIIHELPERDEEEIQMKSDLVEDLKTHLTDRQVEIFVMLANGMEQTEIATHLGVSKQSVHDTIKRGRNKIKEAGWIFV